MQNYIPKKPSLWSKRGLCSASLRSLYAEAAQSVKVTCNGFFTTALERFEFKDTDSGKSRLKSMLLLKLFSFAVECFFKNEESFSEDSLNNFCDKFSWVAATHVDAELDKLDGEGKKSLIFAAGSSNATRLTLESTFFVDEIGNKTFSAFMSKQSSGSLKAKLVKVGEEEVQGTEDSFEHNKFCALEAKKNGVGVSFVFAEWTTIEEKDSKNII